MRRSLLLILVLACNSNPSDRSPTLGIAIDCAYPADGGIHTCPQDAGVTMIPYLPGGPITVDITVTPPAETTVTAESPPLRATVQLLSPLTVAGSTSSGTASLPATGSGSYFGSAALAWPIGGSADIQVTVGGQVQSRTLTLTQPQLALLVGSGTAATPTVVPVCIQSSTIGGNVAVHLDQATFPAGATDQVIALELGSACAGSAFGSATTPAGTGSACSATDAGISTFTTASYAVFNASTSQSQFLVTMTLQGASSSSPAALTYAPIPICAAPQSPAPPPMITSLCLASGSGGSCSVTRVALGDTVTITAGTSAHATVAFASSPSIVILPVVDPADGNGSATAMFAMPDLGSGALVISATAGGNVLTATLTN